MIEKFRNRLVLLTTTIVALVLIVAFLTIYISSYLSVQADISRKMNQIEEITITEGQLKFDDEEVGDKTMIVNRITPGLGLYFNMIVDKQGKLLAVDSAVKLSKKDYQKAAKIAWENNSDGLAKLTNRDWQYIVAPAVASLIYNEEEQVKDGTYLIRFLDITDSTKSLVLLALTLIIVGIILLVFFFLVIVYFANRSLKPMTLAWEKQKQFITDASHELKTPLSIISINADVLYSHQEETISSQIKWLDNISLGTERMTRLVNKLLVIAKTGNDSPKMTYSKVTLDSLILDSLSLYGPKFNSKNITVTTDFSNLTIISESELISQLVELVLDNAYKYTNQGGHLDISLKYKRRTAQVVFKNSGPGIAKEDLPRVFDRFYRTNDVRQTYEDSYGLGLAIAQTIVAQLGGKIGIDSGKETNVTIQLPIKK